MTDTLRSCIVAESGYTLISLDASQIELRVLAILSQDPQMLNDLQTGDLHLATAIRIFGWTDNKEEMEVRRYKAKQGNFALIYGADEFKMAEMLECSVDEVITFMGEHRETYLTLYAWIAQTKAKAREDGYVQNPFGRIRPLPELYGGSWKVREKAEREVVNTIVQGMAIDIVKQAMLVLRGIFDKRVRLVLNVHDEIVFECPNDLLQRTVKQCQILKQLFPQYPFDLGVGTTYNQLREVDNDSLTT